MNVTLTRESANRVTRLDNAALVVLPDGVFTKGEMLILFNNSDKFITLESKVPQSYQSARSGTKTMFEWPPRALVNVVFVDDSIAVISVGVA